MNRYPPVSSRCPHLLHGADYNPEQWIAYEGVWEQDMRLMKLARCNVMSVGIFSWTALEPEEGAYTFDWLDRVMDMLANNGAFAVLATPSGARPAWMSQKYPEVLRVRSDGGRNRHGRRHNHCYTSPVYREKTQAINRMLAERYKDHPALILWHVSNEYGGECYCDLCQDVWREWLRARYTTLDTLNDAWWTRFWSHTYTDWSQIEAPMPVGENLVQGMNLDWRRFATDRHVDFCKAEIEPLREITPAIPVTTNFMGFIKGVDYRRFAGILDVVSWDSYPSWHATDSELETAAYVAMAHDMNRSLKHGRPFLLMESTPSTTNWMPHAKLKRPGMHLLSSLQAIAHGSDSVQCFQWRKSRGSAEQFHGAVVDHAGHENTRVFRDVAQVGEALERLDDVVGTTVPAKVALIFDWDVRWAIDDTLAITTKESRDYVGTSRNHYAPLWRRGAGVDVIGQNDSFEAYEVLIAPMLYLVHPGVGERIEAFVKAGGTFVTTYWSGIVNEYTQCFLGGFPGPLRRVLGIWSEEIDTIHDHDSNELVPSADNGLGLDGRYGVHTLCDLIHTEGAEVLATYERDFYAGRPALTVNRFGNGRAYYIAARTDNRFLHDFYGGLVNGLSLPRAIAAELPEGVVATRRTDGENDFVFLMNFTAREQTVDLGAGSCTDMLAGESVSGSLTLEGYGVRVLRR